MTIAERISDAFTKSLDLQHLSAVQCWILHGIKSVAMGEWARETLKQARGF